MGITKLVFLSYNHLKLKLRVSHSYYGNLLYKKKVSTSCLLMSGHLCDTIIVA